MKSKLISKTIPHIMTAIAFLIALNISLGLWAGGDIKTGWYGFYSGLFIASMCVCVLKAISALKKNKNKQ